MNNDLTRDDVLAAFPLTSHLEELGIKLVGAGDLRKANRCPGHQHKKDHLCVSISVPGQWFHCNDCDTKGTIVDWLAIEQGKTDRVVYKELCDALKPNHNRGGTSAAAPTKPKGVKKEVGHYDYVDEQGEPLFRVKRFEPKVFEQWRSSGSSGFVPGMDGVTRVLYRLPELIASETVICCEGEKDADSLSNLGFVATTSAGGAKSWLPAYAEFLKGKHIVIFPDNDEPGKHYADAIIQSVTDKALSVKMVHMPSPHKDVSDYIDSFVYPFEAYEPISKLIESAPHVLKPIPFYTVREMEERYVASLNADTSRSLDLGKFLPSLGGSVRKIIPGELVCIMAGTGTGKTCVLQGIARAAHPLTTLFFELELPSELMFERFVQMESNTTGAYIERAYRDDPTPRWQHYEKLSHILVCPESGLTVDNIEALINRSQLKSGDEPAVVLVDYIGLVRSDKGRSRYEAVSYAAEQLKVIAKRTKTIVVMATQIHRPYKPQKRDDAEFDSSEVGLHDAKDSGSVENSAGLVLGAWRTDAETLKIRVLKNTKGISGREIVCNFDGARMKITERSKIADEDVPPNLNGNGHYQPDLEPDPEQNEFSGYSAYPDP